MGGNLGNLDWIEREGNSCRRTTGSAESLPQRPLGRQTALSTGRYSGRSEYRSGSIRDWPRHPFGREMARETFVYESPSTHYPGTSTLPLAFDSFDGF
ncbi:hypothetical protein MRX96_012181 [Rhipicephalus microplus]